MKLLVGFILLFATSSSFGLTQGQALAISKGRIELLQHHFATLANNCFQFEEECGVKGNSQEATVKWLSDETSTHDPVILYASGADKFTIDGAVRVAKTGNKWGDAVYFNEDLLVQERSAGNFQPLGFFEILGILVHEYGHHQALFLKEIGLPPLQHEELDEIAAKVVTYLQDRTRRTSITAREVPSLQPDFFLDVLQIDMEWNNGIRNLWSKIFIDSSLQHLEISRPLVQTLKCPKKYQDGHLVFVGKPYYVAFQKVRAPRLTSSAAELLLQQEVGTASVFCIDERMNRYEIYSGYTQGLLKLHFVIKADGTLSWSEDGSSFTANPPAGS